jgi:hypothetical protein
VQLAQSRTTSGTSVLRVRLAISATAVNALRVLQASNRTTINLDATCALLSAPISQALTVCRALHVPLVSSLLTIEQRVSPVRQQGMLTCLPPGLRVSDVMLAASPMMTSPGARTVSPRMTRSITAAMVGHVSDAIQARSRTQRALRALLALGNTPRMAASV